MIFLFPVAIVWGVVYGLIFLNRPKNVVRALAKTGGVVVLALAALVADLPLFLVAALALSALGDWFLAFDGERNFLGGLVSFALAHLAYAALFFAGQDQAWASGLPFLAGTVLVFTYALGIYRRLRPHLGSMRIPAAIYCGLIAAMAVAAWSTGPNRVLLIGVLLFMASDTMLAFDAFVFGKDSPRRRWSAPAIWFSYFAAQVLIFSHFAWDLIRAAFA